MNGRKRIFSCILAFRLRAGREHEIVLRDPSASYGFSLQVEESTDVSELVDLLLFVRYCFQNRTVEDLLWCRSQESHTADGDTGV
jgi:hypothetical protein